LESTVLFTTYWLELEPTARSICESIFYTDSWSDGTIFHTQPTLQRNHAKYLCPVHGKGSTTVETDLQSSWHRISSAQHTLTLSCQALQLLEYLIKHGSERVVDDARSHISTLKMLRNFHYIDDKGKDEGVNGEYLLVRLLLAIKTNALHHKSVTAHANSSSSFPTSTKFAQNAGKQRQTSTSTLELATMAGA